MNSFEKQMIIIFIITLALVIFTFSSISSSPYFISAIVGLPIFIILMLLAVFGKDLFKKSQGQHSEDVKK